MLRRDAEGEPDTTAFMVTHGPTSQTLLSVHSLGDKIYIWQHSAIERLEGISVTKLDSCDCLGLDHVYCPSPKPLSCHLCPGDTILIFASVVGILYKWSHSTGPFICVHKHSSQG